LGRRIAVTATQADSCRGGVQLSLPHKQTAAGEEYSCHCHTSRQLLEEEFSCHFHTSRQLPREEYCCRCHTSGQILPHPLNFSGPGACISVNSLETIFTKLFKMVNPEGRHGSTRHDGWLCTFTI
jgi:hypothetical protein